MIKIERTDSEFIVRLPLDMAIDDIQRMIDFLSYKQVIKESKATESQIFQLAQKVKKGWWAQNKHRFPDLQKD